MENRAEFLKKLSELVVLAKGQGDRITIEETTAYFSDEDLTEEQMELVFDYLLSQKVVVQGYIKMTDEEEKTIVYTEEETAYLDEYMADLQAFSNEKDGERRKLFARLLSGDGNAKERLTQIYLKEVVEIAKEMYHPEIFLGDMIQEGNLGLVIALDMLEDVQSAETTIQNQIRQSIQMLIEEHTEVHRRDKKMVEQVTALDEGIKALTEELGRKVTIDELALYMGMSEEEISDVLRLMGEENEESEETEERR